MFDEAPLGHWFAGAAILAVAYLVRGVAGFGSGLIAVPLLSLFFPIKLVVPLIVLLDYAASATQGVANRTAIRWREILPIVPFSVLGVLCALFFLSRADAILLTRALGLFIIAYAALALLGLSLRQNISRLWGGLAGMLGGLIGTLFGTGGPFYVVYFKARGLEKDSFRATFATTFLIDGAGRLSGYFSSGVYTPSFMAMVGAAVPVMGAALYAGGKIQTDLSPAAFRKGICILLIGSGIVLLGR